MAPGSGRSRFRLVAPLLRLALRALALGCLGLAALLGPARPAYAQAPTDLTKLTLEELMGLDVISVNVLGSHIHLGGEWMIGYEYSLEHAAGNRDEDRHVSRAEVLRRFPTVPTEMTMEMHMVTLMYAPTNDLTFMGMVPWVRKVMEHNTRRGLRFTERAEGIGDLQLVGLVTLYKVKEFRHRLLLNAGLSVPTGSIQEKDTLIERARGRRRLEYMMQLGSGTVDILPGLTYLGHGENWAWGAEAIPTVRLGENTVGYRLGNRYRLSGWGSRQLTEWLSLTGRADGLVWENIHGSDPVQDPAAAATKDPKRQAGERVDLWFGFNLYAPKGILKGQRVAVEGGAPVYQSLDGPNLQTDWLLRVGWQWVF